MSNDELDTRADADDVSTDASVDSSAPARGGAEDVYTFDDADEPDAERMDAAGRADEPEPEEEDGDRDTSDDGMSSKKSDKDGEKGSFWKELPVLIVIALVLAFIIKTWVVQPFYIPSKSMEDTLLVGDRVLVNKLVYQVRDIERGDIIVFNGSDSWDEGTDIVEEEPANPVSGALQWVGQTLGVAPSGKDYIKRVIGLPGDTVECCDEENRILVNGEPVDEPYLYPDSIATHQEFGPVTVEEGWLWVMGDHRVISYDSRTHQGDPGNGSISEESVVGRAFVTIWPLNRIGTLSD